MEAITVFTVNKEQSRVLKAFLQALEMTYQAKETTLEEMEARLMPGQLKVWQGLKTAIHEVKEGKVYPYSLDNLLSKTDDENNSLLTIR